MLQAQVDLWGWSSDLPLSLSLSRSFVTARLAQVVFVRPTRSVTPRCALRRTLRPRTNGEA